MASHSPCAIINFFECTVRRAATNICTPAEETYGHFLLVCGFALNAHCQLTIFPSLPFSFGFASMTLVTRLQTFYTATPAKPANANTIFRSFHVLTFISANILFEKTKRKWKSSEGKNNFSPLFQFQSSCKIFAFNFHSCSCSPKNAHEYVSIKFRNDTAVVASLWLPALRW